MVPLEVREDVEDLGKVPFSSKRLVRRHHRYFTAYINSTEIHHPPNNSNKLLIVSSISSIQFQDLDGSMMCTKINAPLSNDYRHELDRSPELVGADGAYYQYFIGILQWMVELGRIGICYEVSMVSSQLALPREVQLAQVFHIFAYLKKHHNYALDFDPSYLDVNIDTFLKHDLKRFYGDFKEYIPPNMPEPLGKEVVMRCFADADHA